MRLVHSAILATSVALLTSCGSGSTLDSDAANTLDSRLLPAGSALPGLPVEAGAALPAPRQANVITQFPGSGFIQASGATVEGDSVFLQSEPDGLAWALYRVPDLQGKYVDRFGIQTLPQGPGHPYTVGVSNYTDNRWEYLITGTLPEVEIDLTENTKRLISQLGNIYYVVIVSNGDSVRVDVAWFNILDEGGFGTPPTPTDMYATQGNDSVIYLYWAHPETADFCELWRHAEGEEWALYQTTTTGFYMDTAILPDVNYDYKVRAVNDVGHSAFTEVVTGYATVYPDRTGFIEAIDATTITVDGRLYSHDASTEWWDSIGTELTWQDFSVGMPVFVAGIILESGFYASMVQGLEEGT